MTLELFSTSAPAGLEPGTSGYCTVAMTRGLPRALAEQLDSLSAYRPAFMPGDPRELENPVAWSHLRVVAGGKTYTVLSRTCFAGLDHTNRTNRFAHHVVLDGNDARPAGGPAWLLMQDGFLEDFWDGQVKWLNAGRRVPQGDLPGLGCPTWAMRTGDAGWAGFVLEKLLDGQTLYLVADTEHDLLPLLAEAIALLPGPQRWNVTFSTYFTGLPHGTQCSLRGVLRGSPEAQSAPRSATLDLAALAGQTPPASDWVEVARGNRRLPAPSPVPMPGRVPAPMGHRPVAITPMENGEGELYVEDGPVWRQPLDGPPPLVPMPRQGPVLTPIGPPDVDLEAEERPEREAKRRVGLGVLAGAGIGVLLLGVVGLGAVVLFGDKLKTGRDRNGDKDRNPPVVSNEDKGKSQDKDKGGAPIGDRIDVGQLKLELLSVKDGGKADDKNSSLTIKVGQTIQLRVTLGIPILDMKGFPWDKIAFRIAGGKTTRVTAIKDSFGLYSAEGFGQAGTFQITAALPADVEGYTAKESAAVTLKVELRPMEFTLKLEPARVLPGKPFALRLEGKRLSALSKEEFPHDRFTFLLDDQPLKVDYKGKKEFQATTPSKRKKYSVVAKFEGTAHFAPARSEAELSVVWRPWWKIGKKPEAESIRSGKAVVEVEFDSEKENELGLKPDGLLALQVQTNDEKFRDVGKPQQASDKVTFPIEKLGDGKHVFRIEYRPNEDAHEGGVTEVVTVKLDPPPKPKNAVKEYELVLVPPSKAKQPVGKISFFRAKMHKESPMPPEQFVLALEVANKSLFAVEEEKPASVTLGDKTNMVSVDGRQVVVYWLPGKDEDGKKIEQKTRLVTFGLGMDKEKKWYAYHFLNTSYTPGKRDPKEDEKMIELFRKALSDLMGSKLLVCHATEKDGKLQRVEGREPAIVFTLKETLKAQ